MMKYNVSKTSLSLTPRTTVYKRAAFLPIECKRTSPPPRQGVKTPQTLLQHGNSITGTPPAPTPRPEYADHHPENNNGVKLPAAPCINHLAPPVSRWADPEKDVD